MENGTDDEQKDTTEEEFKKQMRLLFLIMIVLLVLFFALGYFVADHYLRNKFAELCAEKMKNCIMML